MSQIKAKSFFIGGSIAVLTVFTMQALGVRLSRLTVTKAALVDISKQTAFDLEGNPISMKDNFVSEFAHPIRRRDSFPRQLKIQIPGADHARIVWDGRAGNGIGYYKGEFTFEYPVIDSDKSIPYRIEAAAEGWQEVDSFDPARPPQNVKVDEYATKVIVSYTSQNNLNLNAVKPEFRMVFEPESKDTSYGLVTPDKGSFNLSDSTNQKLKEIRRVKIMRRDYNTVSEGRMAFGQSPDKAAPLKFTNDISIEAISAPDRGGLQNRRWDSQGNDLTYNLRMRSFNGAGNMSPELRYIDLELCLGALLSDTPEIKLLAPKGQGVEATEKANYILGKGHVFHYLTMFDPKLTTPDINIGIADGPFKEVARKDFVMPAMIADEPNGEFFYAKHEFKESHRLQEDFLMKVDPGFEKQSLRVFYETPDGTRVAPHGVMKLKGGYVGFSLNNPSSSVGKVKRIIIESRPYKQYTIKNVYLYPKNALPH